MEQKKTYAQKKAAVQKISSGKTVANAAAKKQKEVALIDRKEYPLGFLFTQKTFQVDKSKNIIPEHRLWKTKFLENRYKALYQLGFEECPKQATPSFRFLALIAEQFLKDLTGHAELEIARESLAMELPEETANRILGAVPYGIGTEYIDTFWLKEIYQRLNNVYVFEIEQYQGTVAMYLAEKSQQLRVPERIYFHLVENDKEIEHPFAFLATYATKDERGYVHHLPLQYALTEYKNQREKLLELLSCLNQAAETSPLLMEFVKKGEMFHPLRLTSDEAFEFLKAIPAIEEIGILCRIPDWWRRQYASPSLSLSLGDDKPAMLGFETLVRVLPRLVVNGMELTKEEILQLMEQTEGLALLRGHWVEVNHEKLRHLLEEMEKYPEHVSLREALQMEISGDNADEETDERVEVTNGTWLATLMHNLRQPLSIRQSAVPKTVHAELRPYQKTGYTWLNYMAKLGFGACLADDMGLGKTLQTICYLEKLRQTNKEARALLLVPASLLGNWQKEIEKFAPKMDYYVLHGKTAAQSPVHFLTITTYGMVNRLESLREMHWTVVLLDEAQAIKNAGTRQTKAVKKLQSDFRIAMTGTPIENELSNLWSLFDYLNPGLLGSSKEFAELTKSLEKHPEGYGRLKNMVNPFILRRLKTDKSIISDLPEKLEKVDYVELSKKQVVLYRRQVMELEEKMANAVGIQKKGIILSAITKLKEICNHPDQFLKQETYDPMESGKFQMLENLCQTIAEKGERVLVFTQYKEMTKPIADYLEKVFGQPGLVLHGGTRVNKRSELVDIFNGEEYVPFMVLSVKAGGTGLNLTSANHVIHFDRWWNPAVENQATDRAFRIGQQKNVLVHKLVSGGTIEEKINEMIESKKELAENVIGEAGEHWITEMSDKEILSMLRLEV